MKYPQTIEEAEKAIALFKETGKDEDSFGRLIANFYIKEFRDDSIYYGKTIELYKNCNDDYTLVIRGLYFEIGFLDDETELYEDQIIFNDVHEIQKILQATSIICKNQ